MQDVVRLNEATERTGREHSITIGMKGKQLFTCNNSRGDASATDAPPCDIVHGKSRRIADFHTHPYNQAAIGITPSGGDLYTTLRDSAVEKKPQESCITNHVTPLIGCYQNKRVPSHQTLAMYEQGAVNQNYGDNSFLIDHFPTDFITAFYRPDDGHRVMHPQPVDVVDAALGGAGERLKSSIDEFDKSSFCMFIQAMTMPKDARVSTECRRRLSEPRDIWNLGS
jgi:hypothetical protein